MDLVGVSDAHVLELIWVREHRILSVESGAEVAGIDVIVRVVAWVVVVEPVLSQDVLGASVPVLRSKMPVDIDRADSIHVTKGRRDVIQCGRQLADGPCGYVGGGLHSNGLIAAVEVCERCLDRWLVEAVWVARINLTAGVLSGVALSGVLSGVAVSCVLGCVRAAVACTGVGLFCVLFFVAAADREQAAGQRE